MLKVRVEPSIHRFSSEEWTSFPRDPSTEHGLIGIWESVMKPRARACAVVSDERGPYATIYGRCFSFGPAILRRTFNLSATYDIAGGIRVRDGVTLEEAIPRLRSTLRKM